MIIHSYVIIHFSDTAACIISSSNIKVLHSCHIIKKTSCRIYRHICDLYTYTISDSINHAVARFLICLLLHKISASFVSSGTSVTTVSWMIGYKVVSNDVRTKFCGYLCQLVGKLSDSMNDRHMGHDDTISKESRLRYRIIL
jgi:hypothetical protein